MLSLTWPRYKRVPQYCNLWQSLKAPLLSFIRITYRSSMADKTDMHSEYITLVLKRLAWQSFRGLLHNSSTYLELPVCIFTRTISALPDLLLVLCKVYYKLEIQ